MTKKLLLLISIFSIATLSACTSQEAEEPTTEENPPLTMEELAKHNSEDNCWLLINGNIYDVTEYAVEHPGGPTIYEGCGIDSTELFKTRPMGSGTPHSEDAQNYLENFLLGPLE